MLMLTIGHADAYVTVWSSLRNSNREHRGRVGVAAPPAIRRGPGTDTHAHLTDIPKIPPKPFVHYPAH